MSQVAASRHARSPDALAPPPDGYPSWDRYMLDVEDHETSWRSSEYVQGFKALVLATSLGVYRALISGQPVPKDALRAEWARRYGL